MAARVQGSGWLGHFEEKGTETELQPGEPWSTTSQDGRVGEQQEGAWLVVRGPGPAYLAWIPVAWIPAWVEAGWSRREGCTGTRQCVRGTAESQNVKNLKKFKKLLSKH